MIGHSSRGEKPKNVRQQFHPQKSQWSVTFESCCEFLDVHRCSPIMIGLYHQYHMFFLNLFALWTLLIWYDWTSEIVQTRLSCSKNTHTSSLLNLHHLPVSNYYRDGNIQDIPWMAHGSSFSGHNTFFFKHIHLSHYITSYWVYIYNIIEIYHIYIYIYISYPKYHISYPIYRIVSYWLYLVISL